MTLRLLCGLTCLCLIAGCPNDTIGGRTDSSPPDEDAGDGEDGGGGEDGGSGEDGGDEGDTGVSFDTGGGGEDSGSGDDGGMGESNHPPEACFGASENFDDDRDGLIDETCDCVVGSRRSCYNGPPETMGRGICHAGVQSCDSMGAVARWGECMGMVKPGPEFLANGFDDDCDGIIDEPDGECRADEMPRELTCNDGQDNDCDGDIDCDDGDCSSHERCRDRCMRDVPESNLPGACFDGFDNDCDGDFDCRDSDCEDVEECREMLRRCPPGQTGVYTERNLPRGSGSSSISRGDGRPIWEFQECGTSPCYEGQVYVQPRNGAATCVEPPDDCPGGQSRNYVGGGRWSECGENNCDLIVEYGHIYDWQRLCAPTPRFTCPSGQVPTYIFETETWQCRRTCDNTLYDQIRFGGVLYCVPC